MNRFIEIARARTRLERYGWPRLQMSVIVLVTGAAGLLASFLLLAGGLESMLLRYPLAVLIAYGVFLVQMAVWTRWGSDASDALDLTDLPTGRTGGGGWSGSGGHSGGGGASASWGPSSGSGSSSSSSGVDLLDGVDGDGLPLLVLIALVAVAVVCVIAAGWVVWTAPALMAELMVDAAIAGGLYKRMRGTQSEGWWWLCVRHTFWPLLGVLLFFVALGVAAKVYAPQATTLMQALQAL
ncbi:hypothetical protein JI752_011885 [Lysobacter sp. MMG2]|uniref:hypothetical protein n=1 Tax=Lysobacter sp. MMG2 TaxID=2801338 RepID=UPI001C2464F9|nr:hypothetical protein [Lysobacter sp. MMG2]MBU8976844.1 hypothetical protein [Lysobacter sp. MMG2]